MKYLMICLFALNFLAPFSKAQAGCNPCVCGPGGDYEGDIGEWFRVNCPSTPPRPPAPTPRPGRPMPPQVPVQVPGHGRP